MEKGVCGHTIVHGGRGQEESLGRRAVHGYGKIA